MSTRQLKARLAKLEQHHGEERVWAPVVLSTGTKEEPGPPIDVFPLLFCRSEVPEVDIVPIDQSGLPVCLSVEQQIGLARRVAETNKEQCIRMAWKLFPGEDNSSTAKRNRRLAEIEVEYENWEEPFLKGILEF